MCGASYTVCATCAPCSAAGDLSNGAHVEQASSVRHSCSSTGEPGLRVALMAHPQPTSCLVLHSLASAHALHHQISRLPCTGMHDTGGQVSYPKVLQASSRACAVLSTFLVSATQPRVRLPPCCLSCRSRQLSYHSPTQMRFRQCSACRSAAFWIHNGTCTGMCAAKATRECLFMHTCCVHVYVTCLKVAAGCHETAVGLVHADASLKHA